MTLKVSAHNKQLHYVRNMYFLALLLDERSFYATNSLFTKNMFCMRS